MLTGRKKEMQYLRRFYEKGGSQIVVLYGQAGVGKTRLIREFAGKLPCFYYACRDVSEREQQFRWGKELSEAGRNLKEFPDWRALLAGSMQMLLKKQVLVLDEFQHIMKNSASFMEELISFAEEKADKQGLFVILVSSAASWVEGSMIKKMGAPAHKLSGLLKIRPLSFGETQEAFPKYSAEQLFGLYAVLGGNPGLWQYMSPEKSLKENICDTLLSPTGALFGECRRILSAELRELNVYQTLLSALASGRHKLNDIYEYTRFSRAKISVYLKNLMELGLVEKVFSYDAAGREHMQKGVYRICNHLVHFTFTYLYPAASKLQFINVESFYENDIEPTLRRYQSYTFKEMCKEYLLQRAAEGVLPFVVSIAGEWAGKAGDIDIVLQSETGETLLAVCEYEKAVFSYEDYEWLLFLAKQAKLRTDYIWLFADGRFEERLIEEAKEKENLSLILL